MRVAMDPDVDLALRCAWLSLIGGYTHEEIAARISTSRTKVTRLIQAAQRAKLVKVTVEGAPANCVALEEKLAAAFGLERCSVTPDLGEPDLPLSALGALGAHVIHAAIERHNATVVGIGHGRTLSACVDALPLMDRPDLKLVALLGSLTRTASTSPYDVIFRFVGRTGGTGYCVPAPFFCDSEEVRALFLAQRDIVAVRELAESASVAVVGIGSLGDRYGLMTGGMITTSELDALHEAGAVGEILGTFLDAEGRPLDVELNRRVIATNLESLRGREVIAVAGGPTKASAIAAVLRNGVVNHLVTDEVTAQELVELAPFVASKTVSKAKPRADVA